jgi:DNA-binding NtrC family response regulator
VVETASRFPFLSILINAESGTGKELLAERSHVASKRSGECVTVNCAAIPENLIESALFGIMKGAYTGAFQSRPGLVERAEKGTLFLDEIGDMPLTAQTTLLRFLQNGTFCRVGGTQLKQADVRIIAATNRNLKGMVETGLFREDLYYRLKQVVVNLPPLRERGEDKIILAHYFLKGLEKWDIRKRFSSDAEKFIRQYSWPGNVRELENTIKSVIVYTDNDIITAAALEIALSSGTSTSPITTPTQPCIEDDMNREAVPASPQPKAMNADGTRKIAGLNASQQKNQTPEISVPTKPSGHERPQRLIEFIEVNGPIKTADIRKKTGIPKTTLQNTLNRLVEEGLIDRQKTPRHFYYFQYEQNLHNTEPDTYNVPEKNTYLYPDIMKQERYRHPDVDDMSMFQTRILSTLSEKGVATAAELEKAARTSRSSTTRRLNELIEDGKVQRMGKGKRARYVLVNAQDLPSENARDPLTQQTGQAASPQTGQAEIPTGQVNPTKYQEKPCQTGQVVPLQAGQADTLTGQVNPAKYQEKPYQTGQVEPQTGQAVPLQTGQAVPLQTGQAEIPTGQVEPLTEQTCKLDDIGSEVVTSPYVERISPTVVLKQKHYEMVEFTEKEPRSLKSLMQFMNLNHRESFIKKWLKPLLEAGLLMMTIPEKPNSPKQRYKASAKSRDGPRNPKDSPDDCKD